MMANLSTTMTTNYNKSSSPKQELRDSQRQSRRGAADGGEGDSPAPSCSSRSQSQFSSWDDPRHRPRGYTDAPLAAGGHRGGRDGGRGRGHDDASSRGGDRRGDDSFDSYHRRNGSGDQYPRHERESWHRSTERDNRRNGSPRSFDDRNREGRRSFDERDRYRDHDRCRDRGGEYYGPPHQDGSRRERDPDRHTRLPRKKPREEPRSKKPEWPPPFEKAGAAFLFDARSGMFYEPFSDFFYDPKTKLYYGNKKRGYFRYDVAAEGPGFQPVGGGEVGGGQGQGQAGGSGAAVVTVAEETAAERTPTPATETKPQKVEPPKPKIAISLKTAMPPKDTGLKSLPLKDAAARERTKLEERKESSLMATAESNDNVANPTPGKKHAKDMNKWSERQEELRDGATPATTRVRTTAAGQPICVLCRRKFASLEKLRQHEKLSALHKENLSKRAAAAAAKKAEEEAAKEEYRDRSKERRDMYQGSAHVEPGSSHAEALFACSLDAASSSTTSTTPAPVVRPEEMLNATNIGNRLLHKLGWKSGDALGRGGNPGAATPAGNEDVASNLKSDWERIESLAMRGGGRR